MVDRYIPVGFHFAVTFGNFSSDGVDARFSEVSGLSRELGIEELAEGGENRFHHKLPKRAKYPNLILRRGLLINSLAYSWIKNSIENFQIEPSTINVSILNEEHVPIQTYSFVNAYPVSWSVSDLDASLNEVVIESIEFAYQHFKKV